MLDNPKYTADELTDIAETTTDAPSKNYVSIENAWVLNVRHELKELKEKIDKLFSFIATEGTEFKGLTDLHKTLLKAQLRVMVNYKIILETRLSLNDNEYLKKI